MADWKPFFRSQAGIDYSMRHNADGTVSFLGQQDVAPLLDRNKAMANHNDGYSPTREMRRVASIPAILINKWRDEEGWDPYDPANAAKLAQKLNDPDYLHLRTAEGRLGVSNGVMR